MVEPPDPCRRRSSLWRWWLLLPSEMSSNGGGGVEQHEGAVPSDYMWYVGFLFVFFSQFFCLFECFVWYFLFDGLVTVILNIYTHTNFHIFCFLNTKIKFMCKFTMDPFWHILKFNCKKKRKKKLGLIKMHEYIHAQIFVVDIYLD